MLILQVKNLGMFAAALFTYNPYDNAQIIHVAKMEKNVSEILARARPTC